MRRYVPNGVVAWALGSVLGGCSAPSNNVPQRARQSEVAAEPKPIPVVSGGHDDSVAPPPAAASRKMKKLRLVFTDLSLESVANLKKALPTLKVKLACDSDDC